MRRAPVGRAGEDPGRENRPRAHQRRAATLPLHEIARRPRLLPGEGVLDLPAFVAALRARGLQWPGVAGSVQRTSSSRLDPLDAAQPRLARNVKHACKE